MSHCIHIYHLKMVKEREIPISGNKTRFHSASDVAMLINEVFDLEHEPVENFGIICFNLKNEVIGAHLLHRGTISQSYVSLPLIFQHVLLNNAHSFICFHNHTSGDPTPSRQDIDITKKILKLSDMFSVRLLDHIIIGHDGRYHSMQENADVKFNIQGSVDV